MRMRDKVSGLLLTRSNIRNGNVTCDMRPLASDKDLINDIVAQN